LRGHCRHCHKAISILYPAIELFTATILMVLYTHVPLTYFFAYFVFFSALIVTIRSDIETMLISRFVTICLIPFGFLFSACGFLPLTLTQSIAGCLFGFFILFGITKIFWLITHKEGIGQGDIEVLAFIGSFLGIIGCWLTLFLGSLIGTTISVPYIILTKKKASQKIPFGPFLSLGAILFVLYKDLIIRLLF
jgi:leader peptidase (prepilin peptidase)/N-methyltransferase